MDDAQRRATAFNADQRIAELEAEVARLRRALEKIRDLDIDEHPMEFANQTGRIAMIALAGTEELGKKRMKP